MSLDNLNNCLIYDPSEVETINRTVGNIQTTWNTLIGDRSSEPFRKKFNLNVSRTTVPGAPDLTR